jgi:hypothetical protein
VGVWHALYFQALFAKLHTLKDRNLELLFGGARARTAYKAMMKRKPGNKAASGSFHVICHFPTTFKGNLKLLSIIILSIYNLFININYF